MHCSRIPLNTLAGLPLLIFSATYVLANVIPRSLGSEDTTDTTLNHDFETRAPRFESLNLGRQDVNEYNPDSNFYKCVHSTNPMSGSYNPDKIVWEQNSNGDFIGSLTFREIEKKRFKHMCAVVSPADIVTAPYGYFDCTVNWWIRIRGVDGKNKPEGAERVSMSVCLYYEE